MEKEEIKAALTEASEIVGNLPQHLQVKAFELAVVYMLGGASADSKGSHKTSQPERAQAKHHGGDERPAVSDLLKICKNNADKYVVFMHDLEDRAEAITPKSLLNLFNDYRQDKPGNVPRDLKNLSADDWAKPSSRGRGATWDLRDKGRKRYAELVAALHER